MSTRQKGLTKLQEQIVDALADDYEDMEQIRNLIGVRATDRQIQEALWALLAEGYVAGYSSTKTAMKRITRPERPQLGSYWFALTKKGEQLFSALQA